MSEDLTVGADPRDLRGALLARHVAVVGLAGVGVGIVVGGGGGRLSMGILAAVAPDRAIGRITENGNRVGELTLGGTLELLIFLGVFAGAVGAVAYLVTEPWLRWTRGTGGLAFALLLLGTGRRAVLDPDNRDFAIVTHQPLAVGLFAALFLLFGLALPRGIRVLDRRLPMPDPRTPWAVGGWYLGLAGLGALTLPFLASLLVADLTPTSVFFFAMGAATAVGWWAHCRGDDHKRYMGLARRVGYLSLAGAFTAGAVELTRDLITIL